jgi:hypothetical protein
MTGAGSSLEMELILEAARQSLKDSRTVARTAVRREGGRAVVQTLPDWDKTIALAEFHGTIPQLQQHLSRLPEGIVPAPVRQALADRCRGIAARNLLLTRRLTEACAALEGAGIRVLAFKGPTLAILGYGDLSLRQFNDIDMLIHPADFQRALETARQLGYDFGFRITPSQQIQYARAMGQVALRDAQGTLLELHTKLTDRAYHFPLDFDALWSRRQPVALHDHTLHTLGNEDLLLYAAAHGTKHAWPCLGWVLDLVQLVTRNANADWAGLLQRATAMRCRRLLLLSLELARDTLGLELPAAVAQACAADRAALRLAGERARRLKDGDIEHSESAFRTAGFQLRSRDRLSDGAAFLWATIFEAHLTDWQAINLPSGWEFLYPIARPLRLVLKYLRPAMHRR